MSWTLRIQRSLAYSSYTKYKVTAYREGVAGKLSLELQLDRKSIVSDFQELLSDISGESRKLSRPRSLQKFSELAEDPLQSIFSIGTKIYSALDVDLKNTINDAENIHIMTDVIWRCHGK